MIEYLKLFVELVSALAWPATILFILFFFKDEIVKALKRLKWFKYKDLEAEFNEKLQEAETSAKQLKEKSPGKSKTIHQLKNEDKVKFFDRIRSLAEDSPRGAILEGWVELVNSIQSYIDRNGIETEQIPPYRLIRLLSEKFELEEDIIKTLHKVRNLRNQAVHTPEFVISNEEAERYIDVIELLDIFFRPDE